MFHFSRICSAASIAIVVFTIGIAGCDKVTPDNYAKIQTGQSEADVEGILGKPTATETASGAIGSGAEKTWKSGDKTIKVVFINGKVMGSEKSGF